jgi:hypothetical protein
VQSIRAAARGNASLLGQGDGSLSPGLVVCITGGGDAGRLEAIEGRCNVVVVKRDDRYRGGWAELKLCGSDPP